MCVFTVFDSGRVLCWKCDESVRAVPIDRSCSSALQKQVDRKEVPSPKNHDSVSGFVGDQSSNYYVPLHSFSSRCQSHVRTDRRRPAVSLMRLAMPDSGGPTDNSSQGWLTGILWELSNSAKRDQGTRK